MAWQQDGLDGSQQGNAEDALLRQDLVDRLSGLLSGSVSREEAADWAVERMARAEVGTGDEAEWVALTELSGADLQVAPGRYLHDERDVRAWLAHLVAE